MQIMTNAAELDVRGWFRGLISAAISGGCSALSAAIVLPSLDSHDFNVFSVKYYIALFAMFVSSALVSVAKFLSGKPIPDEVKEVTNMTQTITGTGPGSKIIETTKETHTEPLAPKGP